MLLVSFFLDFISLDNYTKNNRKENTNTTFVSLMFSNEIPVLYFPISFKAFFLFYLEFLGSIYFFHHLELEINSFVSNVNSPLIISCYFI